MLDFSYPQPENWPHSLRRNYAFSDTLRHAWRAHNHLGEKAPRGHHTLSFLAPAWLALNYLAEEAGLTVDEYLLRLLAGAIEEAVDDPEAVAEFYDACAMEQQEPEEFYRVTEQKTRDWEAGCRKTTNL